MKTVTNATERAVCRTLDQPRSTQRYRARSPGAETIRLVKRMHELVRAFPRYGYRLIWGLLRNEGWKVNVKRIYRLWKQEHFIVPRKQRKRRSLGDKDGSVIRRKAEYRNHVWCWDFIFDSDARHRALKWLVVMDEFTRECVTLQVARSMTAEDVIDHLASAFRTYGVPEHIRSDNGPEFIAKAIKDYLGVSSVMPLYIEPGSPWQNGYAESLNSRLRDEVLNAELFEDVRDAEGHAVRWREHYNTVRPHSSLGYLPPSRFAATCSKGTPHRLAPLATAPCPWKPETNQPLTLIEAGT